MKKIIDDEHYYRQYKLMQNLPEPDARDFSIERLAAPVNVFPENFCLDISKLKIKDQGNVGSCLAHALASAREITEYKQSGTYKQFSPGYIYANRDDAYKGEGLVPGMAHNILKKYGVPELEKFPHNEQYETINKLYKENKEKLDKSAYPYRISSYCLVRSENEIKNALMQVGPITLSMPILDSFYSKKGWDGCIHLTPKSEEKRYGYHAVCIVGWKKDLMIVVNSWGENWKDEGKFYLPFDFPYNYGHSMSDTILPGSSSNSGENDKKPKYYRVQIGAFKYKNNAEKLQAKIKHDFGNTYLVYVDGLYKVQIGAYAVKENAINKVKELKNKGYNGFIIYY